MARGSREQAGLERLERVGSIRIQELREEGNQMGWFLWAASKGAYLTSSQSVQQSTSTPWLEGQLQPKLTHSTEHRHLHEVTKLVSGTAGTQPCADHQHTAVPPATPALCRQWPHCRASCHSRWPLRTLALILKEVEISRFRFLVFSFLILLQLWQLFPYFNTDFYNVSVKMYCENVCVC